MIIPANGMRRIAIAAAPRRCGDFLAVRFQGPTLRTTPASRRGRMGRERHGVVLEPVPRIDRHIRNASVERWRVADDGLFRRAAVEPREKPCDTRASRWGFTGKPGPRSLYQDGQKQTLRLRHSRAPSRESRGNRGCIGRFRPLQLTPRAPNDLWMLGTGPEHDEALGLAPPVSAPRHDQALSQDAVLEEVFALREHCRDWPEDDAAVVSAPSPKGCLPQASTPQPGCRATPAPATQSWLTRI